jgi:hypothetical protein
MARNDADQQESSFVRLLSRKGAVKTLDILLRKPAASLTAGQIADEAGFRRSTFHRNKKILIELGMVEVNRENSTDTYSINTDNEYAKLLAQFHTALIKDSTLIKTERETKDAAFMNSDSGKDNDDMSDWTKTAATTEAY